mmetsp:Transcript_28189/g.44106  ORF Transcript_28189/g.44106 Transcript_28189/m.44106 type:complete len:453 (-) Transcript_28189:6-1364(-)
MLRLEGAMTLSWWIILLLPVSSGQHFSVVVGQGTDAGTSRPIARDSLSAEESLGAQLGFATTSFPSRSPLESRPPTSEIISYPRTAPNGAIVIDTAALSSTVSPLTIYTKSFRKWLQEAPYQESIALLAIAVGGVFLWDGPALWHFLFTGAVAIAGAFVAYQEGKAMGLATTFASQVFLALEVGCVVGYATHMGFEGTQVMLGAVLGCLGAYGVSAGPRSLDLHFPGVMLAWYSIGAVLGLLVYTTWRQSVLATFAPLLGGIFVSSGCGILLSRLSSLLHPASVGVLWFPPHDQSWIEGFLSLIGNGGGGITLAALCGCALIGAVAQSMSGNRTIAIFLIIGGIAFSTLAASACQLIEHASQFRCPAWLTTTVAWQWLVVGSLLWASTTGIAAYCQLGKHDPRSAYFPVDYAGTWAHGKDTNAAYFVDTRPNLVALNDGNRFRTILPDGGYA